MNSITILDMVKQKNQTAFHMKKYIHATHAQPPVDALCTHMQVSVIQLLQRGI